MRLMWNRRMMAAVVTAGLTLAATMQAQSNACDLNANGSVTSTDVDLAVNMALGTSPCTANILGSGICNVVVVQRVVNAMTGPCVTGSGRAVQINWVASTSTGVVGYRVLRSTTAGGPYTSITATNVTGTSYVDNTVQLGVTYYYVVVSVNSTGGTSSNSNQATAVVPAT